MGARMAKSSLNIGSGHLYKRLRIVTASASIAQTAPQHQPHFAKNTNTICSHNQPIALEEKSLNSYHQAFLSLSPRNARISSVSPSFYR